MLNHITLFPGDRPELRVGDDAPFASGPAFLEIRSWESKVIFTYQGVTRAELAKLAADINKFLGLGEPATPPVSDATADAEASHQRLAEQTAAVINAAQEELAQPQANQFPAH